MTTDKCNSTWFWLRLYIRLFWTYSLACRSRVFAETFFLLESLSLSECFIQYLWSPILGHQTSIHVAERPYSTRGWSLRPSGRPQTTLRSYKRSSAGTSSPLTPAGVPLRPNVLPKTSDQALENGPHPGLLSTPTSLTDTGDKSSQKIPHLYFLIIFQNWK